MTSYRRQYIAGCCALISTAMAFSIRADIVPALKTQFGWTDLEIVIQEILQDKIAIDYAASGLAEPE